jgi:hypothetical protein
VFRDSGDRHPPAAEIHKEQHIVRNQAIPGEYFHREEVRARQNIQVYPDEVPPVRA